MTWLTWWLRWWCGCHDGAKAHVADLILNCLAFSSGNRALAAVSCAFCRAHLPQVLPDPQFFNMFMWKPSSRYSPARFWSNFPDQAADPREQRPSFGDRASHFTGICTGFRAQECFQAGIHALPISYTSLLDDDMVAMMMWLTGWLTWWCGCHDGEKAGHDNRP